MDRSHVSYEAESVVLYDVSLSVRSGETTTVWFVSIVVHTTHQCHIRTHCNQDI